MGNILKCFINCFDGEDEGSGSTRGHFPNSYPLTSRRYYQPLRLADLQVPLSPPRPLQQQSRTAPPLGHHHGVPWPRVEIDAQCHDFLKLEFTSTVSEGARHNGTSYRKTHPDRCTDAKNHSSSEPHYIQTTKPKDNHGVPVVTSRTNLSPLAAHGASALERDLLNFAATCKVPEGLAPHVTSSSKMEQVAWCTDEKDHSSRESQYCQASKPKGNHVVPVVTSRTNLSPLAAHGASALERDLLNFAATCKVPEGLARHGTSSSKMEQVTWYMKILAAYKDMKSPPQSSTDATMLIATALRGIQQTNLEGVLAFYGFPISTIPKEASKKHPSSMPKGVLFVLKTLPVNAKRIVDGDGFTAYVDTANPIEVCEDLNAGGQASISRKQKTKQKRVDDLQTSLQNTGHKEIFSGGREILARQYEIRLRGIDAPEMGMQYGKESQDALVKLIAWKCVTLHVYGQDQFKRFVCDIYCDSVFIQEQMLVNGHAWHFKNYDKRPQFAKWEKMARDARQGLWAYDNPKKPWEWRKNKRNASKHHNSGVC